MRHRPHRLPGPQARRCHRDLRGPGDPAHVAAVRYDLHVPASRSLKAKRAAIKPIVDGIRVRFNLSVAEVGHHDQWQRCAIGVAVVSSSVSHVDEMLDAVDRFVWSHPEVEVLGSERSWLE